MKKNRRGDLETDINRSVPEEHDSRVEPAIVSLGVRARVTGRAKTSVVGIVTRVLMARAEAAGEDRERFEERRARDLDLRQVREQLQEVVTWAGRAFKPGFLAVWVQPVVITLLVIINLAEPWFMLLVLRDVLDVPRSAPLLSLAEPMTFTAAAVAALAGVVLLGSAHAGGRAWAVILFAGRLVAAPKEYPEAVRTRLVLGRRDIIKGAILLALLVFLTITIHAVAEARVRGGSAAFTTGQTQSVTTAVVWFLTLAPWTLFLLEVIASSPVQLHTRHVAAWSRRYRRLEAKDVRTGQRLLKKQRVATRRVRVAMTHLEGKFTQVWLAVLAEVAEASIVTGAPDVARLAEQMQSGLVPNDGDGRPAAPAPGPSEDFLNALWHSSPVVNDLRARYEALSEVPSETPMAVLWARLREDPLKAPVTTTSTTSTSATTGLHVVGED